MGRAELCVQDERRGAKGLDQIGKRRKKPAAPGTGRAGAEQQGGTGKKQKHIKTGDKEGKECTEKRLKEMAYSKASLQKAGKTQADKKTEKNGEEKRIAARAERPPENTWKRSGELFWTKIGRKGEGKIQRWQNKKQAYICHIL